MKKHAKKSLLLPILALASVIAIAACCYLAQTFNAFAVFEPELESTTISSVESDDPDIATLEEKFCEAKEGGAFQQESNADPALRDITAKIRLSNGEFFRGTVQQDLGSEPKEFVNWLGEEIVTYKDVESIAAIQTPIPFNPNEQDSTSVMIMGIGAMGYPVCPIYTIYIPNLFYSVTGVNVNYVNFGGGAEVSIGVDPAYYICFDANGGQIKHMEGDPTTTEWVAQGELNYLKTPASIDPFVQVTNGDKRFGGWYTHPIWGERVDDASQVPEWGSIFKLYAHWIDESKPVTFHFSAADFGQVFHYDFWSFDHAGNKFGEDSGTTWTYTKTLPANSEVNFFCVDNKTLKLNAEENKIYLLLSWVDGSANNYLVISAVQGQRINGVSINDGDINIFGCMDRFREGLMGWNTLYYAQYNEVSISTGWALPGYISVASDNGRFFKCQVQEGAETNEFVSDFVPIFVGAYEYVQYSYGGDIIDFPFMATAEEVNVNPGLALRIRVTDFNGHERIYKFSDNLFSLFDWLEMNAYILGVNVDGEEIPYSDYRHQLDNGYHNIVLNMSGSEIKTTVTYNANGGKFADGSDTVTLDAVYGEGLPLAETPKADGMDFDGWYTEPVGGFKVDPSGYHWMPWDRWYGVTLYAHWVEAPVPPVPPEPVPPTPPTPDPVNPDVPGGGGSAQTGDSVPLAPIAAIAIVAALGCCLAIRKEYF